MSEIDSLATRLVAELKARRLMLATAESCTGGWIAQAVTSVSGSSACFGFGLVSYSNDAKMRLLNVPRTLLAENGAVSEAVVRSMAGGAIRISGADLAVAVSGIAGPQGGSDEKPVGTVWLAWSRMSKEGPRTETLLEHFDGDREAVRRQTVVKALSGLVERVVR